MLADFSEHLGDIREKGSGQRFQGDFWSLFWWQNSSCPAVKVFPAQQSEPFLSHGGRSGGAHNSHPFGISLIINRSEPFILVYICGPWRGMHKSSPRQVILFACSRHGSLSGDLVFRTLVVLHTCTHTHTRTATHPSLLTLWKWVKGNIPSAGGAPQLYVWWKSAELNNCENEIFYHTTSVIRESFGLLLFLLHMLSSVCWKAVVLWSSQAEIAKRLDTMCDGLVPNRWMALCNSHLKDSPGL